MSVAISCVWVKEVEGFGLRYYGITTVGSDSKNDFTLGKLRLNNTSCVDREFV